MRAFTGAPYSARRNTELGLLLMVVLITGATYTLASLGQDAVIPAEIVPFMLMVLAVLMMAHIVTRRLAPRGNATLLPLAGLLNGLGFVFIARVRQDLAWQQALWTVVGMAVFCGTLMVVRKARDLDRYRWTFALLGLGLLMLPALPKFGPFGGVILNGSRIWFQLGPMQFQPGEGAKIVLAVFFASYLVEKRELLAHAGRRIGPLVLPELRHLGPVLLAWGITLLVMFYQNDFGSSLLFFALFLVMLWVATQRVSFLLVGMSLFAAGAYACWLTIGRIQERVQIWLDPWADPLDSGWQPLQFLYLMSDGGVAGTGLGLSGNLRLPQAESDFIFAVIAGELGLPGALVIISAFVLIVGAGLRIAQDAENAFDKLLATGLTALMGIQAFIIMAGVTRLLPLTGVTLPFVSHGGTSLIANYVLIALLVRISDETGNSPVPSAGMVAE